MLIVNESRHSNKSMQIVTINFIENKMNQSDNS